MSFPAIFDTCGPRPDVLGGAIRDDEFMPDLSRVVALAASTYTWPASETVPAPKIPEQLPRELAGGDDAQGGGRLAHRCPRT